MFSITYKIFDIIEHLDTVKAACKLFMFRLDFKRYPRRG